MKNKWCVNVMFLFFWGICVCACTQGSNSSNNSRWSEEKIQEWYDNQPWLVGCNYVPATAINQIEMWSAVTFDSEQIDKELSWAHGLGFNTLRVFLDSVVWQNDATGMKKHVDEFLNVCRKYSIRPMFVFFDDCWNPESAYDKRPEPKPGVHNSGWVQDPSYSLRKDTLTLYPFLQKYIRDIVRTYAHDDRILMWDLYNKPGNSKHKETSLSLLTNVFRWVHDCRPSQPVTASIWDYNSSRKNVLNAFMLNHSDIISYHNYDNEARHAECVEFLKMLNRPLICTEYMTRRNGGRFCNVLPLMKKEKTGAINWGFVAGKTNTIFAWDEVIPSREEPELWFHDIYRSNGVPFQQEEVDCIKSRTGKR